MTSTKKLQIGIMGSAADLQYSKKIESLAFELGKEIAKQNAILVFGAEKDSDSLSTVACRGAKQEGGTTLGITYGKGMEVFNKDADIIVATGLERGGGREMALVYSCDAIICVSGGSGTLTEIAIAYQANVPIIAMAGTGGWSNKLAGTFLDQRKRVKVLAAKNPKQAVTMAVREILKKKK